MSLRSSRSVQRDDPAAVRRGRTLLARRDFAIGELRVSSERGFDGTPCARRSRSCRAAGT